LLLANDGLSKGPFDKSKFGFNCYGVRMVSVSLVMFGHLYAHVK